VPVLASEQVGVVEQARLERLYLGQPELLVRPRLQVGVERELLLGLVRDRGNLDHAATIDPSTGGVVARPRRSYAG